jgi:hypothetical protein
MYWIPVIAIAGRNYPLTKISRRNGFLEERQGLELKIFHRASHWVGVQIWKLGHAEAG